MSNEELDHHYKIVWRFKILRLSSKKQKWAQTLIKSQEVIKGLVIDAKYDTNAYLISQLEKLLKIVDIDE